MGSTVDLVHLLNGQNGLSYPRGVHQLLARVLAPCILHGTLTTDKKPGWGATKFCSREYSGVFVPLNINTTHVGFTSVFLPPPPQTHLWAPPNPPHTAIFGRNPPKTPHPLLSGKPPPPPPNPPKTTPFFEGPPKRSFHHGVASLRSRPLLCPGLTRIITFVVLCGVHR